MLLITSILIIRFHDMIDKMSYIKYTILFHFSNGSTRRTQMAQAIPLLDSAALGYEEQLPTLLSVSGASLLDPGQMSW